MLDLVLATVLMFGANAGRDIVLPYDDQTLGADGFPVYVDDGVVAGKLPWVKAAGARLSRCMRGATVPRMLTVHYTPTPVAKHVVRTNILRCEHEHESLQLSCDVDGEHETAYFDRDPDQYFLTNGTLSVDDIVPVVHAIVGTELSFADGVQDPQLTKKKGSLGTIEKSVDGFVVRYGDCGCWGRLQLHRDATSGKFVVTHAGYEVCI